MASPELSDMYSLTDATINEAVTQTSAGVYALDRTSTGPFTVAYVGRSDTDLNGRLHQHTKSYKYFRAAYCSSPKAAFEAECELYHDYTPPDNVNHPARPAYAGWKCPRCPIFD